MNKSKRVYSELNCISNTELQMYLDCVREVKRIVSGNGLDKRLHGSSRMVRYSATGHPSWSCAMYNSDIINSGLDREEMKREIVYNYLFENSYDPIPSIWRGNSNASNDVMQQNIEKAKTLKLEEKSAIVIQRSYMLYLKKRLIWLVTILQRKWRLKQVDHMRPFYLIPTPHTDSRPYIFQPKYKLYKLRPSFGMIYYKINNKILTKDMDRKGGPGGVQRTSWYFDTDAKSIYWTYKVGSMIFEVRKWIYGRDFTIKITKDVHRFRGILRP